MMDKATTPKRVLVTGATGAIGQPVCRHLLARGHTVRYVCEAVREFKVERLVLSGSVQAISGHGFPDRSIKIEDGPAPTNHYALTKVWAEISGEMMARCHNISVVSVRIGWLPRNRSEAGNLLSSKVGPNVFFRHNDAQRFYERCVASGKPYPGQSEVLFATSKPLTAERLDMEPAKRIIGYAPRDTWPEGLPFSVEDLEED
jgi:nucleoside-diphosphate-sugar epimerase